MLWGWNAYARRPLFAKASDGSGVIVEWVAVVVQEMGRFWERAGDLG